ncbi:MAG: hypothetical protein WC042_02355 [Candidatus Paceibacterota bacterium]|jgi:hypothetical protein
MKFFEDKRCDFAVETIALAFSGLKKVFDENYKALKEKEIWAMKDIFYLDFDNHYGEAINWIGDTIVAYREACELQREEILKKSEHIIKRVCNF